MTILFFKTDRSEQVTEPCIPWGRDYHWVLWKPEPLKVAPPGLSMRPFGIWWLFHQLGIFYNPGYTVMLVFKGDCLVHRACIFPGYFRFPFMERKDLQIGDVWTHEAERGKGFAEWSLRQIIYRYRNKSNIWYLTDESNGASVSLALKSGFSLAAEGRREKKFGVSLLGQFQPTQKKSELNRSKR